MDEGSCFGLIKLAMMESGKRDTLAVKEYFIMLTVMSMMEVG